MNDNEISKIVDEYLKHINIKRNEFKLEFEMMKKTIEKSLRRN